MSNPFPAEQLRRLTPSGIDRYRTLNDRDQQELTTLRESRAEHAAEIASIDDVMADLNETIGRRQAKMRGDIISLLPSGSLAPALTGSQGDAAVHAARFGAAQDVIEPTRVQGPPSFEETKPEGSCLHCGEPVWWVPVSEASPKGLRHSYGATCDPDDPNSGTADLGGQAIES